MAVCAVEPFPGLDLPLERRAPDGCGLPSSTTTTTCATLQAADATGADRVGLIGFCMGGMYTLKAARSERFARLVAFYGMIRVPAHWRGPAGRTTRPPGGGPPRAGAGDHRRP